MELYFAGTQSTDMTTYPDVRESILGLPTVRILTSYAYPKWIEQTHLDRQYLDRVFLDCGAWTAFTSGTVIDIDKYGEYVDARGWMYNVIASLDVIGDGEGSLDNWVYLTTHYPRYEFIPTFHIGDEDRILEEYLSRDPSLVLLGAAGRQQTTNGRKSLRLWLDDVFYRYPYEYHMFGVNSLPILRQYPFVSCDASSWVAGRKFGSVLTPQGKYILLGRKEGSKSRDKGREDVRRWLIDEFGVDVEVEEFDYNELVKVNIQVLYEMFETLEVRIDRPLQTRLF